MKFGLSIPQFDAFGDVNHLAELAMEAEQAGWDGFFIWDHILFDDLWRPIVDPWIALAAIAMRTERVRIGPMVTPLARLCPWKVARESVTFDHLSNGRLILGVGLGAPEQWEFSSFGEETSPKARAKRLDEGLDVLLGLWSGEPFSYDGDYYQLQEMRFLPKPVQASRIPIWIGGTWPNKAPLKRAARYDGVFPDGVLSPLSPRDWRVAMAIINSHRQVEGPFDVVQYGVTPGDDVEKAAPIVKPFQEVGVTWRIEGVSPFDYAMAGEMPGMRK
jgi:alkanesulfonate monooxygenase SsuD/methylene tetrahydromethanopterin reductase-like flavin-dependent oxidoreductase (luciferase family)